MSLLAMGPLMVLPIIQASAGNCTPLRNVDRKSQFRFAV